MECVGKECALVEQEFDGVAGDGTRSDDVEDAGRKGPVAEGC